MLHGTSLIFGTVSTVGVAGPALAALGSPLFDGVVVGSVLVGLSMLGKLELARSSQ